MSAINLSSGVSHVTRNAGPSKIIFAMTNSLSALIGKSLPRKGTLWRRDSAKMPHGYVSLAQLLA